jgi:hypothetical protein
MIVPLRHTKAPSLREYSHRHGSANSEVGFCMKNYVVQRLDWTLLRHDTSPFKERLLMEHFKQINILKFISINLPPKPCSSSELHGFNLLKKFFKKSLDKQGTV